MLEYIKNYRAYQIILIIEEAIESSMRLKAAAVQLNKKNSQQN